jgi:hypothetical protein
MIVFCDGMPRSASTWSFNVVVNLLRLLVPSSRIHAEYRETFAALVNSLPPECDHAVVKSHQLDHAARELCRAGAAKVIYTWRSPVDAVASYMKMFDQPFDEGLKAIRDSLRLHEFHRAIGGCCTIAYEIITEKPRTAIAEIAAHLGLDAPDRVIEEVDHCTSFKRMKEAADRLDKRSPASLAESGGLLYDHETLLHRFHIRDGRTGYGREILTPAELNRVGEVLAEFAWILNQGAWAPVLKRRVSRIVNLNDSD